MEQEGSKIINRHEDTKDKRRYFGEEADGEVDEKEEEDGQRKRTYKDDERRILAKIRQDQYKKYNVRIDKTIMKSLFLGDCK